MKKRFSGPQIVAKLRQADMLIVQATETVRDHSFFHCTKKLVFVY